MAVIVTQPYITLPSSNECYIYAAHSPIVLTATRQDNTGDISNNGSGVCRVVCASAFDPSVAFGDRVYVEGLGVVKITNVISTTTFDTDIGYTADLFTKRVNFIDLYPDYYLSVVVKAYNNLTDAYSTVATLKVSTGKDGVAKFDVSGVARSVVKPVDEFNSSTYSTSDWNLYGRLRVEVAEYTDTLGGYDEVEDMQIVCAAMPTQHRWWTGTSPAVWVESGANMPEYYTEASATDQGLFLSSVRKLRYWKSLPFTLEWLYSPDMVGEDVARVERILDVNGGNAEPQTTATLITLDSDRLVRMTLGSSIPLGGPYDPDTRTIMVSVRSNDPGFTKQFTEEIEIRYTQCMPKDPVFLKALDPAGGWRYFCFSGSKAAKGYSTRNSEEFRTWKENIAYDSGGRLTGKNNTPTIKIGAELLDEYDRQICEIILISPQVEMLANPLTWETQSPDLSSYQLPQWVTVKVKDGNFDTKTTPTLSTVEMTIELPEVNTQTQ